jgi:hypothetical protein
MPRKKKMMRLASTVTGEVQDWELIEETKVEPYWLGRARSTNFTIMNADPTTMIASATERLDNFSFRVLMFITFKMDMKNEFRMSQADIARAFNVDAPRISKAVKKLTALKLLTPGPGRGLYYVNPFLCWKGNDFDRARAMKAAAAKDMELTEEYWLPAVAVG